MSSIRHMGLRDMFFALIQDTVVEAATKDKLDTDPDWEPGDDVAPISFLDSLEGNQKAFYYKARDGHLNPYEAALTSEENFTAFSDSVKPYVEAATIDRLHAFVTQDFFAAEMEWQAQAKNLQDLQHTVDELDVRQTNQEILHNEMHLIAAASERMWKDYTENNYDDVRRIGESVVLGLIDLVKATSNKMRLMSLLAQFGREGMSILTLLLSTNTQRLPQIANELRFKHRGLAPFQHRTVFLTMSDALHPSRVRLPAYKRVLADERDLQGAYLRNVTHRDKRLEYGFTMSYDQQATQLLLLEGLRYREARLKEAPNPARLALDHGKDDALLDFITSIDRSSSYDRDLLRPDIELDPLAQIKNEWQIITQEKTPGTPLQQASLELAMAKGQLVFPEKPRVDEAAKWLVMAHETLDGLDHKLAMADFWCTLGHYMKVTGYGKIEDRAIIKAREIQKKIRNKEKADQLEKYLQDSALEGDKPGLKPKSSHHKTLSDLALQPEPKKQGPTGPRKTKLP